MALAGMVRNVCFAVMHRKGGKRCNTSTTGAIHISCPCRSRSSCDVRPLRARPGARSAPRTFHAPLLVAPYPRIDLRVLERPGEITSGRALGLPSNNIISLRNLTPSTKQRASQREQIAERTCRESKKTVTCLILVFFFFVFFSLVLEERRGERDDLPSDPIYP